MWDDLDYLLEEFITDDAHAKQLVDALMTFGPEAALTARADESAWDLAEEIAMRIIGNRDLRFIQDADSIEVEITDIGPHSGAVLELTTDVLGELGFISADDRISSLFLEEKRSHRFCVNGEDEALDIKKRYEAIGATVSVSR